MRGSLAFMSLTVSGLIVLGCCCSGCSKNACLADKTIALCAFNAFPVTLIASAKQDSASQSAAGKQASAGAGSDSAQYTTSVIKVPNTTKYEPYGKPRSQRRSDKVLTGVIGRDDKADAARRDQSGPSLKPVAPKINSKAPLGGSQANEPPVPAGDSAPVSSNECTQSMAPNLSMPALDWGAPSSQHGSIRADAGGRTVTASGAMTKLEPLDGRVADGVYRGQGDIAERILKSTAALGDYEPAVVGHDAYRSYIGAAIKSGAWKSAQVVVFRGKWDHAEHLLDEAGIAYCDASKGRLEQQLKQASLVVLNCPAELNEGQLSQIQAFVRNGGYLVSTDWALDGAIARMFPGYLLWKGAYSNPETVDAVPVEPENTLLRGAAAVAPWRLDDKCQIVQLCATYPIDVLVRSRQLAKEDPNGLGVLAATFSFGSGKVLHLVGHFDNNNGLRFADAIPDPTPGIRISLRQAITLNFVVEALAAHGVAASDGGRKLPLSKIATPP